mmetsp:Transcript_25092/g.37149  ORF Transcript_25092/g.37149 Transcript_25092/m.37149 type:complete len:272 (-) Transcript_25092:113-928(-)
MMRNVAAYTLILSLLGLNKSNGFQSVPSYYLGVTSSIPQPKSTAFTFAPPASIYKNTHTRTTSTTCVSSSNDDENDGITTRFLSPIIDDAGLPLADTLLAQVVAPALQVFWLSLNHAPRPTWLAPIFNNSDGLLYSNPAQGSLVAPTLIHGAALAFCWVLGSLAAKGFESDAFNVSGGRGYGTVITRIIQAGAFSTGILIFSTQVDLLFEFGRYVQPGESPEIDLRLLNAIVELLNDVVFEALVLSSWRIYRASLTEDAEGRPSNYDPDQK